MAGVTVLAVTPAIAQQPPTVVAKPNSGVPGSSFTVAWTRFFFDPDCTNFTVTVRWDKSTVLGSGNTVRGSGQINVAVPGNATAGVHGVTAAASGCPGSSADTTFTVRVPPTTTTTVPPVTTQPPPVTTTTTTRPRPPVTTTTTTPGTPPTTTTTSDSTPPSSTTTTTEEIGDGILVLDKDNIQPGEDLTATGTGCPAGAPVTLKAMGENVGKSVADEQGGFRAPVRFATIEPGRHVVRAECGITLLGNVDVTLSSSTGGTTSTLVVLVFFLLVGATMLRRQFTGLATPR